MQVVRPQRAIRQTIIGVAAPANGLESPSGRAPPIRRATPVYVRAPNLDAQSGTAPSGKLPPNTSGHVRSLRSTMVGGLEANEPDTSNPAPGTPRSLEEDRPSANKAKSIARKHDSEQTMIGGLEAALGSAPGAAGPRREQQRRNTPQKPQEAALPTPVRDTRRAVPGARFQPSQPAPIPSFSRQPPPRSLGPKSPEANLGQPTRRSTPAPRPATVASNRAPIASSSHPGKVNPPKFTASAAKLSRGPASVSARSSSPTLELVELDGDDDVVKAVESETGNPADSSQQMHELERLAAESTTALRQNQTNAMSRRPESKLAATGAEPTSAREPHVKPEDSFHAIEVANNSAAIVAPGSRPVSTEVSSITAVVGRHRKRKLTVFSAVAIALLVILAGLVASYVSRQPRPLYAYLHRRGWDRALDRKVRRVIDPAITYVRKWLPR